MSVSFGTLVRAAPPSVRPHLKMRLEEGGLLAPKSLGATVDALIKIIPDLAKRLARYSERRSESVGRLTQPARDNLALQKEALNVALRIAGIDPDVLFDWLPPEKAPLRNYLEGIQEGPIREDLMVLADAEIFPGFEILHRDIRTATKTFSHGSTLLRVTMVNRQELEAQTGADLIYFNETYNSFVMVQYKAMRSTAKTRGLRTHVYRPDAQLAEEIRRMDEIRAVIQRIPSKNSVGEYRLNAEPFYLKLCPNTAIDLDSKALFPGMYLPLEYWKLLIQDPTTLGPKGGRVVGFENVGRKFSNTEFVQLVTSGFVGSKVYQSIFISELIQKVLAEGKAVTLAVQHDIRPHEPHGIELDHDV